MRSSLRTPTLAVRVHLPLGWNICLLLVGQERKSHFYFCSWCYWKEWRCGVRRFKPDRSRGSWFWNENKTFTNINTKPINPSLEKLSNLLVNNRHSQLLKRFLIPKGQQQNKNPKQQKTLLLSRYNMLH